MPDPLLRRQDLPLLTLMLESLPHTLATHSLRPPTGSLVHAPGKARTRPHPPHLARMTHARVLSVDPACSSSARPPPTLRSGSRSACPTCAWKTARAPLFTIQTEQLLLSGSPPRGTRRPRPKGRDLKDDTSAFDPRMATEPNRSVCARRRRILYPAARNNGDGLHACGAPGNRAVPRRRPPV
jgi:hypothetical protein